MVRAPVSRKALPPLLAIMQAVQGCFTNNNRDGHLHRFTPVELNQLSTGTLPVAAVTDPVGFVADTRLGMALGPELWSDASAVFAGESSRISPNVYRIYSSAGVFSDVHITGLTAGKTYQIQFTIDSITTLGSGVTVDLTGTPVFTTTGIKTCIVAAITGTLSIKRAAGATDIQISGITCKLLEGNHAIQATAAARPTWTNRVNDALATEDFNDAAWTRSTTTVTASAIPAPNGLMQTITNNGAASYIRKTAGRTSQAGVSITLAMYVTQGTAPHFQLGVSDLGANYAFVNFNLTTLAKTNFIGGTGSVVSSSITAVPTGGYLAVITVQYSNALTYYEYQAHTFAAILLGTTAGQYGYSWGAQLVLGSSLPSRYQRVTTATDFDTAGFPYYLPFLGTDDNLTSATGGGGSAGFFWCGVVQPTGGAGTARRIFADNGTNTGYALTINASNQLLLQAGNGTAYTSRASTATVDVGTKYLLTVFDDGTNLSVQINAAAAETVARPVVVAGTAGFTIGKDNLIASTYLIANLYPSVYWKDTAGTAAERADAQAYCRALAGM